MYFNEFRLNVEELRALFFVRNRKLACYSIKDKEEVEMYGRLKELGLIDIGPWPFNDPDKDITNAVIITRECEEYLDYLTKQVRDVEEGWEDLIWDRIQLLLENEYLTDLPSLLLYALAREMEVVHLMTGQIFNLVGEGPAKIGVVRTGELSLRLDDKDLGNLSVNEFVGVLPLIVLEKNKISIFSNTEASILVGSQDKLNEMMFDNQQLALNMYRWARDQQDRWQNLTKEMVS